MSSERRINSSRANGAKSRGPVTPEGKRRSAQNSTRHGLVAGSIVLQEENSQAFHTLYANLELVFEPRDEFEASCVETMAVARWRCLRIWDMETSSLQHEIDKSATPHLNTATRAALAFRSLCDNGPSMELLGRYETRYDRQYARAFNLLMRHRGPTSQTKPGQTPSPSAEAPPAAYVRNPTQPQPPTFQIAEQTQSHFRTFTAPSPNPALVACYPKNVTVEEREPRLAGVQFRVASERRLKGALLAEILPAGGGSGELGSQAKSCSLSSGSKGFGWSAIGN